MNQELILEALKKVRSESKKRNFNQSIDLIINLKDLDLKKPDQQVDFYAHVNNSTGKKLRICAFVGPEMKDDAKKVVDTVITPDEFPKYSKKKEAKKLANEHDYFIAQANIMATVATSFGKILGSRGKMPNPKAGCVIPPKTNLAPLNEKLQKTLRLKAKALPVVQCSIGKEEMDDSIIADNILTVFNQLVHVLPNHENNISQVIIKLTMGKIVDIK